MFTKLLSSLGILAAAGLFVAACGDETDLDAGPDKGVQPQVELPAAWPYSSADAVVRYELAKLEAERDQYPKNWPYNSADAVIRYELAKQQAERDQYPKDWPYNSEDAVIRYELAKRQAERAAGD